MNLRTRFKYLLKLIQPIFWVYLIYFLSLEFYVYPKMNLAVSRAQIKDVYNRTIPTEVDYLILGDSSGLYSINPLRLSAQSYSATAIASSLYTSYQSLLQFKKINKGIVLTQTFIEDHYDIDIWKILVPAGIFSLNDIFNLLCNEDRQQCSKLEKVKILAKFAMEKLHLSSNALEASTYMLRNFYDENVRHYSKSFQENVIENHGHFSSPLSTQLRTYQFINPYLQSFNKVISPPPASEMIHLNEIIRIAGTMNVKVYFVLTPMAETFSDSDASQYYRSIYNLLDQVHADNFQIIDGRSLRTMKKEDFLDYNHPNQQGAEKFTAYLAESLKTSSPAK